MATKKAQKAARTMHRARDLPTPAIASVKGGAKRKDKLYDVTVSGKTVVLTEAEL